MNDTGRDINAPDSDLRIGSVDSHPGDKQVVLKTINEWGVSFEYFQW